MSKRQISVYLEQDIIDGIISRSQGAFNLSKLVNQLLMQYGQMSEDTTDKKILALKINKLDSIIEVKRRELNKLSVERSALAEKLETILADEKEAVIQIEEAKKREAEEKNTCVLCGTLFSEKNNKTAVSNGRFAHNACFLNATKEKRTELTS